MAVSRAMLKGMGLTEEQVQAICEENQKSLEAIKAERDKYKEAAEQLPGVQKELDKMKEGDSAWKEKYDKEHEAFENFKKDTTAKETAANVRKAYRKLLEDAKLDKDYIDTVIDATKFDGIEIDSDGKLKDSDKLTDGIKSKWGKFIVTTDEKPGGKPETPPKGGNPEGANPKAAEIAKAWYKSHGITVEESK